MDVWADQDVINISRLLGCRVTRSTCTQTSTWEMRLAGILGRIIKAGWLAYPRPGAAPELSRSGLRH